MYVVATESLLAGRGLRNLLVLGQPAMTNVNPVFPLLLAPVAWLAAGRYGWLQAFCALLLAASPWAIWLYLREELDDTAAALAALLCASSPFFLSQSGTIMSEAPFLLLSLALLAAARSRRAGAASALLLAVSQLRQAGLALGPAACAPWKKRELRKAALVAAPSLAAWLAWTAWSRGSAAGAQKLDELALAYSAGLGRAVLVAAANLRFYVREWGSCVLPGSAGAGPAALAAGAALAAAAGCGVFLRLRRDARDPASWALLATVGLHLLWPWQYERYLIMPLPLLYLAAACALAARARAAFGALLAAQLLFQAPRWVQGTDWASPELPRTYAALRARSSATDVLASPLYVRDAFHAGLRAVPLPPAQGSAALREALRKEGATLVLWQDGLDLGLSLDGTAAVRGELDRIRLALQDRGAFDLVLDEPAERARVYRLR